MGGLRAGAPVPLRGAPRPARLLRCASSPQSVGAAVGPLARPFCALRVPCCAGAPAPARVRSGAPPPPLPSALLRPGARLPPGSPARPPGALAALRACARLSLRSSGLRFALRPLRASCSVALALLRAPSGPARPPAGSPPLGPASRLRPGRLLARGAARLRRAPVPPPPGPFVAARAALAALAVSCRESGFLGQGANESGSSSSPSPRVEARSRPEHWQGVPGPSVCQQDRRGKIIAPPVTWSRRLPASLLTSWPSSGKLASEVVET